MNIIEFISQPWHWSISGLLIVFVMVLLNYLGLRFGMSSSFRVICSAVIKDKEGGYFDFDWKSKIWMFWFIFGSILGGYIGSHLLASPDPVAISAQTISDLQDLGIAAPSGGLLPDEIFNWNTLLSIKGLLMFILGGFFIGFGTRWAGGCTSGHAISGLANLQLPSLVAVVGFFIGGLISTFIILPLILGS